MAYKQFSYSGSNKFGSYTAYARVYYSENYNASTNKTTVSLSSVDFYVSNSFGGSPCYGTVSFAGTTVKTFSGGYTNTASGGGWNEITNSSGGSVTVSHSTSGTATMSMSVDIYVSFNGAKFYVDDSGSVNLTTHTSTLTVNPNGGTWNGSTSSQSFSQAPTSTKTIANPSRTGYTFRGWSLSGGGSFSGTTYTYGASNGTLTATWQINSYAVTLTAGTDIDSVSGGGNYDYNSSVTVTAVLGSVPGYTYAFDGWYDGGTKVSSSLSYTFTMGTSAVSLTAVGGKTPNDYTLSLTAGDYIDSVSGGGTKTFGDTVTVDAVLGTQSGYTITFDGWYNGATKVSSSQSYTFTYNTADDISLIAKATRTINSYQLTLTKGDYIASVSGDGLKVFDSVVTATAVLGSASGYAYSFSGWFDENNVFVSSDLTYTFNMPAEAVSLTAKAARSIIPYTLTITQGTGTAITVTRTSSPNAGAATGVITAASPVYYGDILAVTFAATAGYGITSRTINGNSVAASVNYTVTGNTTITAAATPLEYTMTLNVSNSGVVVSVLRLSSPIGGGAVGQIYNGTKLYYGDEILISYSFGLGYQVDVHTINGVDFDSGDTYTVVGNTTIIVTASASGFVYIKNKAYLAYIGAPDGSEWKRYQAQVGDGSNWIAH